MLLVFSSWHFIFLHRSKGDFSAWGCTEEGRVPGSTLILLGQNIWMNEWVTDSYVFALSFLHYSQANPTLVWATRRECLEPKYWSYPDHLLQDTTDMPGKAPEVASIQCIDYCSSIYCHCIRHLFIVPPSPLCIMSKSYWALTQAFLSCRWKRTWQGRFFTDKLLRGPSHARGCVMEGFTM